MKPSPLQIEHYFVTELHFSANHAFDPAQNVVVNDDQFVVESVSSHDITLQDKWQVTLRVSYQPALGVNSPCSFSIEIVGFFVVATTVAETAREQLAKTNGSSILYATAREIVRAVTTNGPQRGILLPATSFYEPIKAAAPVPTPTNAPVAPVQPTPQSPQANVKP